MKPTVVVGFRRYASFNLDRSASKTEGNELTSTVVIDFEIACVRQSPEIIRLLRTTSTHFATCGIGLHPAKTGRVLRPESAEEIMRRMDEIERTRNFPSLRTSSNRMRLVVTTNS